MLEIATANISNVSISPFQFRYDIDTIFTKCRDIDIDIDIKYVSKMHAFADLNFNGQVFVLLMHIITLMKGKGPYLNADYCFLKFGQAGCNIYEIFHNEKFSDSLAEFSRVVSRSREIFIETFTDFFIVKNFVKFYITTRLLGNSMN